MIRRLALAAAGFLLLELASRPPRPPVEELTDRAAGALAELVLLDAELRGDLDRGATPEVLVPPRSLCLCPSCYAGRIRTA